MKRRPALGLKEELCAVASAAALHAGRRGSQYVDACRTSPGCGRDLLQSPAPKRPSADEAPDLPYRNPGPNGERAQAFTAHQLPYGIPQLNYVVACKYWHGTPKTLLFPSSLPLCRKCSRDGCLGNQGPVRRTAVTWVLCRFGIGERWPQESGTWEKMLDASSSRWDALVSSRRPGSRRGSDASRGGFGIGGGDRERDNQKARQNPAGVG